MAKNTRAIKRFLDFLEMVSENRLALMCNLDSLGIRCTEGLTRLASLPPMAESVARSLGLMDQNGNILDGEKLNLMRYIREYGPELLKKK